MKKGLITYMDVKNDDAISSYNPFVEDENENTHYFMLKWYREDTILHEIYVRLTIDRHMDQHSWVAYNKSGEIINKNWSFGCFDESWFSCIADIITDCFYWTEGDEWTLANNLFFAFVGERIFNEMIRKD